MYNIYKINMNRYKSFGILKFLYFKGFLFIVEYDIEKKAVCMLDCIPFIVR